MRQHHTDALALQCALQLLQGVEPGGVHRHQALHVQHQCACASRHLVGQHLDLAHRAEEQGPIQRHAVHACGQLAIFKLGGVEQRAHAPDEEHTSQHQAHLYRHREVEHDGEQEGAHHHRAVLQRIIAQAHELVALEHVPGHEDEDAGQHGQRHMGRQWRCQQQDEQQRDGVHDAGHRRDGAGAHVGHGARDVAGGWYAAEQRRHEVGHALCHQFLVGVVTLEVAHVVGHARAQQRLDGAQQRNGDGGNREVARALPAQRRQVQRGQARRKFTKTRTDGLHRQLEPPRHQRQRGQCHDGRRQPAGQAYRALPQNRGRQPLAGREQARPQSQAQHAQAAQGKGPRVETVAVLRQRGHLGDEVTGHLGDVKTHEVAQLRQCNQHCDAVRETDDDGHRDVPDQHAQLEQPEQEHQHPGHRRRQQQVGEAVAFDDAEDDDDEGTGRPADLHLRAAERRDQEAGNDGGDQALLGFHARCDAESQRQRQRHDAHRDAGAQVSKEALAVVALDRIDHAWPEGVQSRGGHGRHCEPAIVRRFDGGVRWGYVPFTRSLWGEGEKLSARAGRAWRRARARARTCPARPLRRRGWLPAPCLR